MHTLQKARLKLLKLITKELQEKINHPKNCIECFEKKKNILLLEKTAQKMVLIVQKKHLSNKTILSE